MRRGAANELMPATRLLIVGYGNPLRGDDALGRMAAGRLAQRYGSLAHVEVVAVHQLTLDMAQLVSAYDLVIFLDARIAPEAGQVFCAPIAATTRSPNPLSHYCTPGALLATTQILYGAAPRAYLAGVTAHAFEAGAPLTPAVAGALDELELVIAGLLADIV